MKVSDFVVERLHADFELERAGREAGDDFAQRFGQAVGNHLEMNEEAGLMAVEEKLEERFAGGEV